MQMKRKLDESQIELASRGRRDRVQSSWITSFLSQKREMSILPPPEVELTNDKYLREFSEGCLRHQIGEDDEVNNDEDDDLILDNTLNSTMTLENGIFENSTGYLETEKVDISSISNGKLRLFNLPYNLNKEDIVKTGLKYGFNFLSVVIDLDKRTLLPSGQASIELAPHVDVILAVEVCS
jgi:RNA recognition motif-containing protein